MALYLYFVPLPSPPCFLTPRILPAAAPYVTRRVRCHAGQLIERRSSPYEPSNWNLDHFKSPSNNNYAPEELCKKRAKKLEEKVRCMIEDEDAEPLALLELVDCIQRLGIGYLFEKHIKGALEKIITSNEGFEKSLHATALRFRLLREHGFLVSPDVFKIFTDQNGNFAIGLLGDIEGLLSLYEASYFGFEEEDLLDEAMAFTSLQLNHTAHNNTRIGAALLDQVNHALELPLQQTMHRLEARWYIESYKRRECVNSTLLELAMLDFNMVQSTYQSDLQEMNRWWNGIGLGKRLSFARDRLMECFFWAVGMAFEPNLSNCRKQLTKVAALVTVLDDVYDVYGSLDELQLFTGAVQRWDVSAAKSLPTCMELCFRALYDTVNEMADAIHKEHGQNITPLVTKAWADLLKAFLAEAKWNHNKETPSFKDYFENAWISVSGIVIMIHSYFLLHPNFNEKELNDLKNYCDILCWSSVIFRLCNDLGTSSDEIKRGESANSILCYMNESGLSEEDARKKMRKMIDEAWKKMNKTKTSGSPFSTRFIQMGFNLARISRCTYQYGDGHGAPDTRSRNRVSSVILDPIL